MKSFANEHRFRLVIIRGIFTVEDNFRNYFVQMLRFIGRSLKRAHKCNINQLMNLYDGCLNLIT